MKKIFFIACLLPAVCFASDRFETNRGFLSIGAGLDLNNAATGNICVAGQKAESVLPAAEIRYRLYKVRLGENSYKLKAQMEIIRTRTEIQAAASGLGQKVSPKDFETFCGVKFVSASLSGARTSFGMFLDDAAASKVPDIQLTEFDASSRASEFADLVNQVVLKSLGPNVNWPLIEAAGPVNTNPGVGLADSFEKYRSLVLGTSVDKSTVIFGEGTIYSPQLIKTMTK